MSFKGMFCVAAMVCCTVAAIVWAGCVGEDDRKVAKAKRDLGELAAGMEAFKREYGDYPNVPVDMLGSREWLSSRRLWASLRGWRGSGMDDHELEPRRRDFFATTALEVRSVVGNPGYDAAYPVDPWGNGYRYRYIRDLDRGRYELFSMGHDGDAILGNPRDPHLLRDGVAVNKDNIFGSH